MHTRPFHSSVLYHSVYSGEFFIDTPSLQFFFVLALIIFPFNCSLALIFHLLVFFLYFQLVFWMFLSISSNEIFIFVIISLNSKYIFFFSVNSFIKKKIMYMWQTVFPTGDCNNISILNYLPRTYLSPVKRKCPKPSSWIPNKRSNQVPCLLHLVIDRL